MELHGLDLVFMENCTVCEGWQSKEKHLNLIDALQTVSGD